MQSEKEREKSAKNECEKNRVVPSAHLIPLLSVFCLKIFVIQLEKFH
jgi:hypothetical protein